VKRLNPYPSARANLGGLHDPNPVKGGSLELYSNVKPRQMAPYTESGLLLAWFVPANNFFGGDLFYYKFYFYKIKKMLK